MYSRGNRHQDNITANPSKYPQGFFNSKKCRECGSEFNPMAPSHLYCSEHCVSLANTRKYLKKNYGISYEEYMDLYNKHDGKCHICLKSGFRIDVNQKLDLAVDIAIPQVLLEECSVIIVIGHLVCLKTLLALLKERLITWNVQRLFLREVQYKLMVLEAHKTL